MLSNEKKQQVFQRLRTENYQASMRLEGLIQRVIGNSTATDKSTANRTESSLKTKNVR